MKEDEEWLCLAALVVVGVVVGFAYSIKVLIEMVAQYLGWAS